MVLARLIYYCLLQLKIKKFLVKADLFFIVLINLGHFYYKIILKLLYVTFQSETSKML